MKKENKNTQNQIEQRSKKVNELLGQIPPLLAKWGIAIIVLVLALLVCALVFTPFPYSPHKETIYQHIINTVLHR